MRVSAGFLVTDLSGKTRDEDLAAAAHETRHDAPCRLDLAVGHPGRLRGLQAELAEGQVVALGGDAAAAAAVKLAIFDAGWQQHA
jgi:hypothetical protein